MATEVTAAEAASWFVDQWIVYVKHGHVEKTYRFKSVAHVRASIALSYGKLIEGVHYRIQASDAQIEVFRPIDAKLPQVHAVPFIVFLPDLERGPTHL